MWRRPPLRRPPSGQTGRRQIVSARMCGLDLVGVEAGEIVPFLVVFADVLEAEPAILVEPVARERRAVLAVQPAARRFADPLEGLRAVGRRQGFGSPSRHSANMCSTRLAGKRGERWARSRTRLTTSFGHEFAPSRLAIEDESSRHRGHAGHREGGEIALPRRDRVGGVRRARTGWRASGWSTRR